MAHPSVTTRNDRMERTLRHGAIGAGAGAALIGAYFLFSWLSGTLVSRGLHSFVIKTNASLCLVFCGVALSLAVSGGGTLKRSLAGALASLSMLVGAMTLLEHIFEVDFGIDQLIAVEQAGALGVLHPNRMGPPGALSFTLCGIGILLLLREKPKAALVQSLGMVLCFIASLGILGHLYRVEGLYAVPRLTGIALSAAVGVFLLGLGLMVARSNEAFLALFTASTPAGVAARRLLVPAVVLPILLGWLGLEGEWHRFYGPNFGMTVMVLSWVLIFSFLVHRIGRGMEARQKAAEEERARETLRESEQLLRTVLETLPVAVWVLGLDRRILHANRAALEIWGGTPRVALEDEVYKGWRADSGEPIPPEEWAGARAIRRGETSLNEEIEIEALDGSRKIILDSAVPIRNEKGEITGAVTVNQDITARKDAEDALRKGEEKFRAVFHQAAVGMGRVSFTDARWLDVNEAFCTMLGYTENELRATPWPQITHPEDLDLDLIPFQEMAAGRLESYTVEKRFFHKDGHQVWARLTLSLVRDLHGHPDYEIAIIEDVTSRKEAEEALRKAKDELELRVRERTAELEQAYSALQKVTEQRLAAVEDLREKEQLLVQQSRMAAMGQMLGHIAHQWRQPLNILSLLIQQLQLSYEVGEFSEELLDSEVARGMELINHMSQTITDFKDFLKEEKEAQPFSVNKAVLATVSLLDAPLRVMNVELKVRQNDELVVKGHRNEFSHVVMNLVTNARDALRERGVEAPKIEINLFKEGGRSVITVSDNAGGIGEDVIGKVFDAYFTTKAPDKGTGIGLYMSKSIIEKSMGGRLSVRNTEEGAEFRIEL
ncbi:PAS domain S-box protein [Geomonas sp. RF6]|uniref:PAS domain-containing sensor histidine kinase n=1 Tax=Geomonas sp. RF6 TaxID=2897342 RepID=UPI001E5AB36E|nr:PAS domain S-box protein [Geomonas sp. RF6]UFS71949.1 PAS domain S-box protein [Geomonas sp. RF6]